MSGPFVTPPTSTLSQDEFEQLMLSLELSWVGDGLEQMQELFSKFDVNS